MISFKSKIFIAGHRGLVGSAIVRVLKKKGYSNLLFAERSKLDLKDQKKVYNYLTKRTVYCVVMAPVCTPYGPIDWQYFEISL